MVIYGCLIFTVCDNFSINKRSIVNQINNFVMDTFQNALWSLKGVVLCPLNIRSVYRSLDVLAIMLNNDKTDIDVCFLLASFLNNSVDNATLCIPDYQFICNNRCKENGKSLCGGLLTYISNKCTVEHL